MKTTRLLGLNRVVMICAATIALSSIAPSWCAGAGFQESASPLAEVKERGEISQYGFTWKFARPVKSGQFINGDWWVVGPVTVASATPSSTQGPLTGEVDMKDASKEMVKDMKPWKQKVIGWVPPDLAKSSGDKRMRNGSMVIVQYSPKQGYDSRSATYDPACSVTFPYQLNPNRTLVSTISNANPIGENFCHKIHWHSERTQRTLLRAAAVLTCLASEPPADAFRPPYAGTEKPIYRAKDLHWELLLDLKLDGLESYFQRPRGGNEIATWQDFEGYFQRPWLGHFGLNRFEQVLLNMEPNENQPTSSTACFGREDSRLISIATLMVHLNVPKEQKKILLIALVQRGIDLSGMFKTPTDGRYLWIQSGCKWPILFASLMLDKPELRQLPEQFPFHEDITTYYGTGWFGQTALWRIVWHGHPIASGEELSPEQRKQGDPAWISEQYRGYGSSGRAWLGTALETS